MNSNRLTSTWYFHSPLHFFGFIFFTTLAVNWYTLPDTLAQGAKEPQVVDHVSIFHHSGGGSYGYTIPVYESNAIRFLSGGVGKEERDATYPSYSLKLILAQKGGAFLAHVSFAILDQKGQTLIEIPEDLVIGPWLFVDLPPGTYTITGTNKQQVTKSRVITVKPGTRQVQHMNWPAS